MLEFLHKDRIVAQPGFNRWKVPPASIAIHLCIGSVYAWSMFNPPLTMTLGVVASGANVTAFGLRGNIFRSTDHGVTWAALGEPGGYSLYGGSLLDDGRLALVGAGGVVLQQSPGEESFAVGSHPGRATFSSVTTDTNGKLVLVGMGGVQRLEETADGR